MVGYWKLVNRIIAKADIILEVVDARFIDETRNRTIEENIEKANKRIIIVANKADLSKTRKDIPNLVYISAKKKAGSTMLLRRIMQLSHGEKTVVGVVGYPNTGKSSVINALSGRRAAPTSPQAGFTTSLRTVRASNKIMLIDTPGVINFGKSDQTTLALFDSLGSHQLKDPTEAALTLIERMKPEICRKYQVSGDDSEEILENIARKMHMLQSGGRPNARAAAVKLISDWQKSIA